MEESGGNENVKETHDGDLGVRVDEEPMTQVSPLAGNDKSTGNALKANEVETNAAETRTEELSEDGTITNDAGKGEDYPKDTQCHDLDITSQTGNIKDAQASTTDTYSDTPGSNEGTISRNVNRNENKSKRAELSNTDEQDKSENKDNNRVLRSENSFAENSPRVDKKVAFSRRDVQIPDSSEDSGLTEGALKLKQELERLNNEDEKTRKLEKERVKKEVAKVKAQFTKDRAKRNISIDFNSDLYRKFIHGELSKEEIVALHEEQKVMNDETRYLVKQIDHKYGLSERRKAGSVDKILRKLEKEEKRSSKTDEVTRELTREEKEDLHIAFDMFDTKRRGRITISDLRRLCKMLRFTTGKGILKDMISNLDKTKRGIVDFDDFLQLVVVAQSDGPDPFEEIVQGFDMIDVENKGYIMFEDLRRAADTTDTVFSNTMLREMMTEADLTGDGRISRQEFVKIMLDTNRYRAIKKSMFG